MKKLRKILLLALLTIGLISCGKKVTESEAREVLKSHLQNRYGMPFEVGRGRLHSVNNVVYYQMEIMPSKYVGTSKAIGDYYKSYGTVRIYKNKFGSEKLGTGGDVYMGVNLNETTSQFFKPKLDELFDELYIQVLDIDVWKVMENGDFSETLKYHKENNEPFYIKGTIFVFGKVESAADEEKYQKKIHDFIKEMKETGTFDYAGFWMTVMDERVLSDDFVKNKEDQELLTELYNRKGDDYVKRRAEIMDKYTESFKNTSKENKLVRIENYGKSRQAMGRSTYHNRLLASPIYSIELIKKENWKDKKKTYDIYTDVEFTKKYYYDKEKKENIFIELK